MYTVKDKDRSYHWQINDNNKDELIMSWLMWCYILKEACMEVSSFSVCIDAVR